MSEPPLTPAARLRLALDLFESGVDLQRCKLRRQHPDATDEDIERALVEWLQARPGAEHGDCPGPLRREPTR